MRKTLLILVFSLTGMWLIGCGGSGGGNDGGNNNQPRISVTPSSINLLVGQTAQLTANVQNVTDTRVSWSVQEANGGVITPTNNGAIYTAPWPVGTYHVIVTSVGNTSLTATATFSVSAKFAFMQDLPSGDAVPFSVTPQLGTYAPNGNLSIAGIVDQGTGNPVSVAMESLTLSSDGTKATFDVMTPDHTYDIFIANADASGSPTQLTTDGFSWWPEFSTDGTQIVYIRGYDIWAMNVDGSNQHIVFSSALNGAYAYSATFSPDATKIAAELEWSYGESHYDGIAIMNSDGSNPVPLTGGPDLTCYGWDEMPSFTHDGTQIMFSRWCDDNATETLYTVNVDGTGLAPLYPATPGVWHYNPIAVADKVVFQSNQDFPYSTAFEIYSMKMDGTAVTRITNNTLYDGFDNWWYYSTGSASSQQVTRGTAGNSPQHGFAGRLAKIRNLHQGRK